MVALKKARWLAANCWRRRVEACLVGRGLTFTQWLVLDATDYLIRETDDAVSQIQVANYLQLNRMTVSDAMTALSNKGLVDRGGAMNGMAWRVFVTNRAEALLRELEHGLKAAAAER